MAKPLADKSIAILGAGMSGLCAAIKLREAGFYNITIYEKSDGVGGTWRDNTYPGSGCDVPSHLYSFSFELKPDWDKKWSRQPAILRYFEHCANKYDLRRHLKLSTEITAAIWDEDAYKWRLTTADGERYEHDAVISGLGQLNRPMPIDYPGAEAFEGPGFHSARWDHSVDLDDKIVAVIGNGPSAAQFIPEIAPRVKKMINLQRSPSWVRSRGNLTYSTAQIDKFSAGDWRMKVYRAWMFWGLEIGFAAFKKGSRLAGALKKRCLDHLYVQITEPAKRALLTPSYTPGCKRIVISDDYYPALARDNVKIVRAGLDKLTSNGIVDTNGTMHACDVVIFATGFQSTGFLAPMTVTGVNGVKLSDVWENGAEAHRGVALSGFPNFFMLYGPNTNLGHNSIIYMVETQVNYVVRCLEKLRDDRLTAMQPKKVAQMAFNEDIQLRAARTVWASDCDNWYKTESGKITNNWPSYPWKYRRQMNEPRFSEYDLLRVKA
ncbi:MAG: NAD(P)/FAD-dependent oxidoreductase [Pseudomonadota bacterium]